jgi:dTDP-4-dehydrorhamnose 3,5-epimerase-like enzyme
VFDDERGFFMESFNQKAFDVAVDIRRGNPTFGRCGWGSS